MVHFFTSSVLFNKSAISSSATNLVVTFVLYLFVSFFLFSCHVVCVLYSSHLPALIWFECVSCDLMNFASWLQRFIPEEIVPKIQTTIMLTTWNGLLIGEWCYQSKYTDWNGSNWYEWMFDTTINRFHSE